MNCFYLLFRGLFFYRENQNIKILFDASFATKYHHDMSCNTVAMHFDCIVKRRRCKWNDSLYIEMLIARRNKVGVSISSSWCSAKAKPFSLANWSWNDAGDLAIAGSSSALFHCKCSAAYYINYSPWSTPSTQTFNQECRFACTDHSAFGEGRYGRRCQCSVID